MIESNIGKISKTHSPRSPKNTFWEVFQIKFFAINIKWTKWSQHQLCDLTINCDLWLVSIVNCDNRLWLCYKLLCSIFSEYSQSVDFIKPNINLTHKVKYIVKLIEVWSCFPIYGKLENHYEKLENHFFSHYLDQLWTILTESSQKKEHNQNSSVFKALR